MLDFNVLIPVYNTKPAQLMEAAYSVLNQKGNFKYKVVIVDDGSNSQETLNVLGALKYNCEVHHLNENGGTSAALNKGHEIISSEYIAIMGSDDISHPERFLHQVKHLEKNPQVDVLGTNLYSFYDDDFYRKNIYETNHKYSRTLNDSDYGWLTNHGTVFYKNGIVKDAGGYDISKRRAQDVDLWKRLFLSGKKIHTLSETLYAWRKFR